MADPAGERSSPEPIDTSDRQSDDSGHAVRGRRGGLHEGRQGAVGRCTSQCTASAIPLVTDPDPTYGERHGRLDPRAEGSPKAVARIADDLDVLLEFCGWVPSAGSTQDDQPDRVATVRLRQRAAGARIQGRRRSDGGQAHRVRPSPLAAVASGGPTEARPCCIQMRTSVCDCICVNLYANACHSHTVVHTLMDRTGKRLR